jgi:hypothetical protein
MARAIEARLALDFAHQLWHDAALREEPMTRIASNNALIAAARPSHRPSAPLHERVIPNFLPAMKPVGKPQPKSLGRLE